MAAPAGGRDTQRDRARGSIGAPALALLLLASLARRAGAQRIANVTVSVPGSNPFYGFGSLQVNWTDADGAASPATRYVVTVAPLNETLDFNEGLPATRSPWLWDSGNVSAAGAVRTALSISGGTLALTLNGAANAVRSRGTAPYLLRRVPAGGVLETGVDLTNLTAGEREGGR